MDREKTLAIFVLVWPLPSLLVAEEGPGANSGPSYPILSLLTLAPAPPADELGVHRP